MAALKLRPRRVDKIWGRRDLPACFGAVPPDGEPVGEVWFEDPTGRDRDILIKFLFTSERLSVQVHPDDRAARAHGHPKGKEEAWWVLSAEEDATIAIGLTERIGKDELVAAARDGTIVDMMAWHPACAGDFHYLPAGTIHAIGGGLALVEIQQNVDLTYRLYDYGRDRPLQLDQGAEAAELAPFRERVLARELGPGRTLLGGGSAFKVEMWSGPRTSTLGPSPERPLWLVPLAPGGSIGGQLMAEGEVWLAESECELALEDRARLLVAYGGDAIF